MGDFKVGDIVEVLDETIKGVVIKINGNQITIETNDGFPLHYHSSELLKVTGKIEVSNYEAFQRLKEKEPRQKPKTSKVRAKNRNIPKMEVDLHIHQLTKTTRGMSNYDMLNLQLETAKRQLEFAIGKRIPKVVFIHGVGEGILKEELKYLLKKYPVDFYDADYQKYGLGATEVHIYQNP